MTAREIPLSPTMNVFQIANEKKAKGETVYNFSAGDPALANHPALLEMTMKMGQAGKVPYPPVEGIFELREAFSQWINHSCLINYMPDEVAVTCGGKYALYALMACFLNPGEELIFVAPYYVSYPGIAAVLDIKFQTIETTPESGWKFTPADLEMICTPKTKMLLFNNACNPTGVLYSKEELGAILETANRLGITIVSDEVYSGLIYDKAQAFVSFGQFPDFKDRHYIVQSCSKNFAMSGWRVGYILGNKTKLSRVKAFQQQTTSGVSLLSQWGALGAALKGDEVNAYVKEAFSHRLDLFVNNFNQLFKHKIEKPASALYTFLSLETLGVDPKMGSPLLAERLIAEGNVATVPGEAFGTPGYIRFACSESEESIIEGIKRLHSIIAKM